LLLSQLNAFDQLPGPGTLQIRAIEDPWSIGKRMYDIDFMMIDGFTQGGSANAEMSSGLSKSHPTLRLLTLSRVFRQIALLAQRGHSGLRPSIISPGAQIIAIKPCGYKLVGGYPCEQLHSFYNG
jgi:hypothetical protein